jgi:hypothetical protein
MSAGLAPEAVDGIRSVLADLDRQIAVGQLNNDPALGHLMVTRAAISAMHRLMVDGILAINQAMQPPQPPTLLAEAAQQKLVKEIASDAGRATRGALWDAHKRVDRTITLGLATCIAALVLAGVGGGWWWGASSSLSALQAARINAEEAMDAARIEVPAVFGSLSAADASAWAKLIRDNVPIGKLLANATPNPGETRGKAVWLGVWVDPPKPPTPGAH